MLILRDIANAILAPVGLKLVRRQSDLLYYQHDYGAGGFAEYRRKQIEANIRKLERVWAEDTTLTAIAADIKARGLASEGICHGARNGFEVKWLAEHLHCKVIGTDISETASQFADMVQHDFHEVREDWVGRFSFVYSNSLDQAFDPRKALAAWAGQLAPGGRIYIEHTLQHSASGASEMDPFGAHPMVVPYLLFEWGKDLYSLDDIIQVDVVPKGHVWVFVLKGAGPA